MCKVWLSKLRGLGGLWTWLMVITSFIKLIGTAVLRLHRSPHLVSILPSHCHNTLEQLGYARRTRKSCWFESHSEKEAGEILLILFLLSSSSSLEKTEHMMCEGRRLIHRAEQRKVGKSSGLCSYPSWSRYQNYLRNWLNCFNCLVSQEPSYLY